MKKKIYFIYFISIFFSTSSLFAQIPDLNINWKNVLRVSQSVPTLQVVNNPSIRRNSAVHDNAFAALHSLGADYVRYVAWYPYPKLAVAELEPPDGKKTSWDFSLIDPIAIDFLEATKGHPVIFNFSAIPQWMFKTGKRVTYPTDPDKAAWSYNDGNELRDTTLRELSDYYARVVSWYTKGGFTDELGKYHKSNHYYTIPYWEIFNEPELEHSTSIEQYTKRYDAIVGAIRKISPQTKFVGMASVVYSNPHEFEYFLNPANHKPGIPLDMISYHFYSSGNVQTIEGLQYSYFDRSDAFLNCVRYIENIRKRLSPTTKSALDELGTFVSDETRKKPIPGEYWDLSASVYAYLYIELSKLGIDVIGESHLVGFYDAFPDVCMMNGITGKPNARYWVLKMIKDNFSPGDSLVETNAWAPADADYTAQGFVGAHGKKVLILNK